MKPAEPQLVKISELARLSGVPSPTIKHYMREGLLPGPARRTSRNMAYYDARLADRVRAIKDLQQEHFLPLKLIGEVLEPAPSGELRADLDDEMRARLRGIGPAIQDGIAASRQRRMGPAVDGAQEPKRGGGERCRSPPPSSTSWLSWGWRRRSCRPRASRSTAAPTST